MRLVFDIETNGLAWWLVKDKKKHSVADRVWIITLKDIDTGQMYVWHDDYKEDNTLYKSNCSLAEVLELMRTAKCVIGHNIIQFDIPILETICGFRLPKRVRVIDTLLMSRVLYPDRQGGHSLGAWGEKLGYAKPEHEDWSRFSADMITRNTADVNINHLLYDYLLTEMKGHDWRRTLRIEHDVAKIISNQERNGCNFNQSKAGDLVNEITCKIQEIDKEILPYTTTTIKKVGVEVTKPFKNNGELIARVSSLYEDPTTISGPFQRIEFQYINFASEKQVKAFLFSLGWVPDEWNYNDAGDKTSPKITDPSLLKLGKVGKLLLFRNKLRHKRSQIQGFLKRLRYDGRLTGSANTNGTNTGRMRHSIIANVPKAHAGLLYGTEMRSLFTHSDRRLFVGHDAAGLEMRMIAHYINDKDMIDRVIGGDKKEGTDVHTYHMQSLNDILSSTVTRDKSKELLYATVFDATVKKLSSLLATGYEGQLVKDFFYDTYPGLVAFIENVKRECKKGWVLGLDGRKVWMRTDSRTGRIQYYKATNTKIQSAGAIIMKKAMVILDEAARKEKLDFLKVIDMHDEQQNDVLIEHSTRFGELARASIVQSGTYFNLNIPLDAEVKMGNDWSETH